MNLLWPRNHLIKYSKVTIWKGIWRPFRRIQEYTAFIVAYIINLKIQFHSNNLIDRLSKHEDWEEWRDELKENELICISYTLVEKQYNERVEAALINSNQPLLNVVYTNSFPFDKTSVSCSGSHEFIKSENIVDRH